MDTGGLHMDVGGPHMDVGGSHMDVGGPHMDVGCSYMDVGGPDTTMRCCTEGNFKFCWYIKQAFPLTQVKHYTSSYLLIGC